MRYLEGLFDFFKKKGHKKSYGSHDDWHEFDDFFKEIDQAVAKKDKGDQKVEFHELDPKVYQKPRGAVRNFVLSAAALLGFGASAMKAGATNPGDTLESKKMTAQTHKAYERIDHNETVGHITLQSETLIPQSDTTREVYAVSFDDDGKSKSALGLAIALMQSKGYFPADRDLLEEIYTQNNNDPSFEKKMKWLMAPTPETDANDTKQNEKVLVSKDGKTAVVLPDHSVLPTKNPQGLGRFELDQGIVLNEYQLLFWKSAEKNNSEQDAIAKNK